MIKTKDINSKMEMGEIDYKLYHYDDLDMENLKLKAEREQLKALVLFDSILCVTLAVLLVLFITVGLIL